MNLKSSVFLKLAIVYLILACFICVDGKKYSQSEIDDAFGKMIPKKRFFVSIGNKTGCWPQKIIPYTISTKFTPKQIQHIHRHIYQVQNRTCLRWVEMDVMSQVKKYVSFKYSADDQNACYNYEFIDGKSKVITQITLGDQCFVEEGVIHEMMHALGFIHEHQRIDRDCYVIVGERYARSKNNFKIVYDDNTFEKWPYDKRSIVHYRRMGYALRDKDEPFGGLLWKHRLGDSYGWWGKIGKSYGKLTCLDAFKINYRFCGAPDFCATQPEMCQQIEEDEKREGCKDLYEEIAMGRAKPSKH